MRGKGRFKPCQFGSNLDKLNQLTEIDVLLALQTGLILRRSGHNCLQVVGRNETFNSLF